MKLVAGRKVCWQDDAGGHHVGVEMLVPFPGHEPPRLTPLEFPPEFLFDQDQHLIRHAHTAELEFVPVGALRDYPQSPIPEPGK